MKKKYLIPSLLAVMIVGLGILAKTASTDLFTVTGRGSSWGQDIFRITSALGLSLSNSSGTDVFTIDTNGNVQTYNDITVGDDTTPSTSFYPGIKLPIYYNSAVTQGDVILSTCPGPGSASPVGIGTISAVLSTTTIIGVADGTYAAGDVGYMTIQGYALVKTTGTVNAGDHLTSTATTAGYAGRLTAAATVVVGSVLGTAVGNGTAAGGLTLAIIGMK